MADNVNIIVQDTINDIVVNAAQIVETIDINVQAAVDVVDIVANPNNYVVNINRIIGEQVQSDWTQTDNQAPDYIKNKPTIPAAQVNSDWNATSGVAEILNKPSIPTATSDLTNDGADGVHPFITAADVPNFTSVVKHIVKNNGLSGTITKGTAVYVTSSNGTNMLVGRASNASEATSSKTMGLMESDITTTGGNQTGYVVTEGLLEGLNTATATAGDPVWLGVNGALIYGLANKPYAPAHLVFIGIVTKVSAGNGEIFVKVQNGFELSEIHTVDLITNTPINGQVLGFDGTLWVNKTIASWLGFTPVTDARTISTTAPLSGGGDLTANRTLSISQASTSSNGYLSSTDWNTFNGKFTLPSLTSGSVLFSDGTTIAQNNTNFFWNNSSIGLCLGGTTLDSNYILQINGTKGIRISGTATGYGYNLLRGTESAAFANNGSAGVFSSTTTLTFNTASTERMRIFSTGNISINTTTDAGFKLDVNGTARVSGAFTGGAAITATTSVTANNGNGFLLTANTLTINGTGSYVRFNHGFAAYNGFIFEGYAFAQTTGETQFLQQRGSFAPTSGTATFNGTNISPTINQTGGANGITRGLYINPTLTAAADFRAIEVANGITILGASTTTKASLRIPSGTAPTTPTNGDIWFDGTNLKMQIGGVTKTFTLT